MKLLFSYDIFYLQKYGGISSYFVNLAKEFLAKEKKINVSCKMYKNLNLHNLNMKVDGYKINYPYFLNDIIRKINNYFFQIDIKKIKPDIIHFTYFNSNLNEIKNIKKIINCWDLTHEKYNKQSELNDLKRTNFLEADRIICPSFTVKKDLLNYYKVSDDKVHVTYFSSDFDIEQNKNKKFQNYILYVGSRSGYKNFEKFIESFSLSEKLKKDFNLLIFGGESPKINGLDILKKYKIKKNKFKFISGTNNELKYYYKNVRLFVYPSRYEGFGIPLVESMRLGCPILSSDGGALKEVGGDGITYFNPDDVEDIKFKLENYIYDDAKLNDSINYGYRQCKKYSWEKCTKETYDIYGNLF